MSDDSQLLIPESFVALYVASTHARLRVPKAEIAARYEWCEDLANMLTDTAGQMQLQWGATDGDVLARVAKGLQDPSANVSAQEAHWVLCRLAELMGWEMPAPSPAP